MLINRIIFYNALKETMEEYFQKTSLNGFGLLYYIRRRKYQRLLWFFFILLGCTFASYVVFLTINSFMENPTVTTLAAVKNKIWDIPFPSIAVCSANKISRRKVEIYAKELANRSHTENYWQRKLIFFGGYYDYDAFDFDDATELELELRELLGTEYNGMQILKSLAPDCEELLLECYLAGRKQECNKLFKMITTVVGYCCVFNHQGVLVKRNSIRRHAPKSVHYPNGTGIDMGLVLLLNSSTEDYFYKSRSTNGFQLQIFEVHITPDTSVGGVNELMIAPGTDTEVELLITSQSVDDETRSFSLNKRRCYFEDENSRIRNLAYSASECLSWCRSRSVRELCECLPFNTPEEYLKRLKNVTICCLIDLECMANFFVTWHTFRPIEFEGTDLLRQESLSCPRCFPLCGFKKYSYRKESRQLSKTYYLGKNRKYLTKVNDTSDVSLVKLYFSNQYATLYNKKVLYNWYQILSNIGGVIGISIGCSIISGFEILYFISYRLLMNILRQRKLYNQT